MSADLLQFLIAGVTVGACYGLVGVGFSIIYNASQVINFAQGEFVMIAGLGTTSLLAAGMPYAVAIALGVLITVLVGVVLEALAIAPARQSSVVTLIIITVGASIFLRGAAELVWGRNFRSLPPFSGAEPIALGGAVIQPQSLWVLGGTAISVVLLSLFFAATRSGKAMLATACNPSVALLLGIDTRAVLRLSFAIAALLGGIAGVLIAPISLTYTDVGVMLGLKGFCAAILGGLGNPFGAVVGGLIVGVTEALTAGYLSSAYKDAVAFVMILVVLIVMPRGLFGAKVGERV